MIDNVYFRQAELLLRVLPLVDREAVFALKGGTAINFFVRDLPRISVDIRPVFEAEFRDMTLEEVTCEDLEKTREELVSMISRELTIQEKQFIVSVKEGMPQWDLIGIEGVENLPAVKWKLLNISRMNPSKHKKAVHKLRDYLEV